MSLLLALTYSVSLAEPVRRAAASTEAATLAEGRTDAKGNSVLGEISISGHVVVG